MIILILGQILKIHSILIKSSSSDTSTKTTKVIPA